MNDQPAEAEEAGSDRFVRPYTMTGGRTRSEGADLPFEALVVTTRLGRTAGGKQGREQARIIDLCTRPLSVAEVSAHLNVPLGVARVLVGDMTSAGLVEVHRPRTTSERPDLVLLERVLDGIRAI